MPMSTTNGTVTECEPYLSSSYAGAHCVPALLYDSNLVHLTNPFQPPRRRPLGLAVLGLHRGSAEARYRALHCVKDSADTSTRRRARGLPPTTPAPQPTCSELWIKSLNAVNELEGHSGCVNSVSMDEAGEVLLTGSDDRCVCLYDTASWSLLGTHPTLHHSNIFSALFVPNASRTRVLTCALDGQTFLLDITTGQTTLKVAGQCMATSLACSTWWPETAYAGYDDGGIVRLDTRCSGSGGIGPVSIGSPLPGFTRKITALAVHSRFPYLLASATDHSEVFLHDVRMGGLGAFAALSVKGDDPDRPTDDGVGGISFSQRGDLLAVNYRSDDIYLVPWIAEVRRASGSYTGVAAASELAESEEGGALSRRHSAVREQPTYGGRSITYIQCHHKIQLRGRDNNATMFKEVAWMADDTAVASGGDDGNVYMWRSSDGKRLHRTRGDGSIVNGVLCHPNSQRLITCGIDSTVKVLEPDVSRLLGGTAASDLEPVAQVRLGPGGTIEVSAAHGAGSLTPIRGLQRLLQLMSPAVSYGDESSTEWETVSEISSADMSDYMGTPLDSPSDATSEYGIDVEYNYDDSDEEGSSPEGGFVGGDAAFAGLMTMCNLHVKSLRGHTSYQCGLVEMVGPATSESDLLRIYELLTHTRGRASIALGPPLPTEGHAWEQLWSDRDGADREIGQPVPRSEGDSNADAFSVGPVDDFAGIYDAEDAEVEGLTTAHVQSFALESQRHVDPRSFRYYLDGGNVVRSLLSPNDAAPSAATPATTPQPRHRHATASELAFCRLLSVVQRLQGLISETMCTWRGCFPPAPSVHTEAGEGRGRDRAGRPEWLDWRRCVLGPALSYLSYDPEEAEQLHQEEGMVAGPLGEVGRVPTPLPTRLPAATSGRADAGGGLRSGAHTTFPSQQLRLAAVHSVCDVRTKSLLRLMNALLQHKEPLCESAGQRALYWRLRLWLEERYVAYFMSVGGWRDALLHCSYIDTWHELAWVRGLGGGGQAASASGEMEQQPSSSLTAPLSSSRKRGRGREAAPCVAHTEPPTATTAPTYINACWRWSPAPAGGSSRAPMQRAPRLLVPLAQQVRILQLRRQQLHRLIRVGGGPSARVAAYTEELTDATAQLEMACQELRVRLIGHPNQRVAREVCDALLELGLDLKERPEQEEPEQGARRGLGE